MVAVQIRDVPDETRDALVRLAGAKGQSLQAFLLETLTDVVRRDRNLAILERIGREATGEPSNFDVVAEIHAARAERDEQLARIVDR